MQDFRSENGLYSLIQAQFDKAAREQLSYKVGGGELDQLDKHSPGPDDALECSTNSLDSDFESGRPAKRRKLDNEQLAPSSQQCQGTAMPAEKNELTEDFVPCLESCLSGPTVKSESGPDLDERVAVADSRDEKMNQEGCIGQESRSSETPNAQGVEAKLSAVGLGPSPGFSVAAADSKAYCDKGRGDNSLDNHEALAAVGEEGDFDPGGLDKDSSAQELKEDVRAVLGQASGSCRSESSTEEPSFEGGARGPEEECDFDEKRAGRTSTEKSNPSLLREQQESSSSKKVPCIYEDSPPADPNQRFPRNTTQVGIPDSMPETSKSSIPTTILPTGTDKTHHSQPSPFRSGMASALVDAIRSSSPLSSPPPDLDLDAQTSSQGSESIKTPTPVEKHQFLYSSSPLSSPPPTLFDPYQLPPRPASEPQFGFGSSTAPSETEETPPSSAPLSSQGSSTRASLPNIKGRDLFDASVWADPLRTSVFYTFATTLRQKVQDAKPTESHDFIGHLRDRGKLVRCYTQNIDRLEEKVGLTTSLQEGPGNRQRFSRKSTGDATSRAANEPGKPVDADGPRLSGDGDGPKQEPVARNKRGVECVYLHGSLESLRCFQCRRLSSWNDGGREQETLSGGQPQCPHCAGAAARREEKGKRSLGVGLLRPDIVLYGEEHPNADLISPIITHDLGLNPDMLLILGTSLRVHGLKVIVKEFAKAVHGRGGIVVFVNFTKPSESSWGDIIDYWVQWDCDAWVTNLKETIPVFWLPPGTAIQEESKKRRHSVPEKKALKKVAEKKPPRPPAARPNALRDHRANGAYLAWKIDQELKRIIGRAALPASLSKATSATTVELEPKASKSKPRKPRKSAPAVLVGTNPEAVDKGNDEMTTAKTIPDVESLRTPAKPTPSEPSVAITGSVVDAVKSNHRQRKRKVIDGEEVALPVAKRRATAPKPPRHALPDHRKARHIPSLGAYYSADFRPIEPLKLPPIRNRISKKHAPPRSVPQPVEPRPSQPSPPGSQALLSPSLRTGPANPFFYFDPLVMHLNRPPPILNKTPLDLNRPPVPPARLPLSRRFGASMEASCTPEEQLRKETEAVSGLMDMKQGRDG
jgi:hercynylcysteine S-oxide lyase